MRWLGDRSLVGAHRRPLRIRVRNLAICMHTTCKIARKFRGSKFVVSVGGVDRTTAETNEFVVTSTVATRHENYDDNTLVNDIAVIKLPVALALSNIIFIFACI